LTKYRKSDKKITAEKEQGENAPVSEQKTGSGYNPETWTEQFFREKREAEERIRKVEFSEGENFEKGIPAQKGIPGHDESEVE